MTPVYLSVVNGVKWLMYAMIHRKACLVVLSLNNGQKCRKPVFMQVSGICFIEWLQFGSICGEKKIFYKFLIKKLLHLTLMQTVLLKGYIEIQQMKDKGITNGKNRKSDNDEYVYGVCEKQGTCPR